MLSPLRVAFALAIAYLATPASAQFPGDYTIQTYADDGHWLCLPTRTDACSRDPGIVELAADGVKTPVAWPKGADGGTDCFYVYPTVNFTPIPGNPDPYTGNRSLIEGVASQQVATLRRTCRIYAPLYRQATIGAYVLPEDVRQRFIGVGAGDVIAAFDYYLANYNRGRRIVLIGHSQGSEILIKLIRARIDANAALRAKLTLGILAGIPLHVPINGTVGGEFSQTPICTQPLQQGCIVNFASYAYGANPKDDTRLVTPAGQERVCVNPATLDNPNDTAADRRTARGLLRGTVVPPSIINTILPGTSKTETLVRKAYSGACVQGQYMRYYSIRDETPSGDARHQIISTTPGPLDPVLSLVLGDTGLHIDDLQFPAYDIIALVRARSQRN